MKIAFHTSFKRQFQALPLEVQRAFARRLPWFIKDRHHPFFQNYAVGRAHPGCRSVAIDADVRALYIAFGDSIIFMLIGTRAELYG